MPILSLTKLRVDLIQVILIVCIWVLMAIIVNPIGNFPLNDDWAYAWSVKELLATGEFKLSDWTATNLLPQVFWGALFCLPLGFSFTALRISTLILGLIGVLATYGLLREMDVRPNLSLLGALVVALNPIYFVLSNSFMTDVPSLTICILALYLILKGFKYQAKRELSLGILLALLAVLHRQSSIVILIAFACAFIVQNKNTVKTYILAFIPLILGVLLKFFYSLWLEFAELTPALFGFQTKKLLASLSSSLVQVLQTYTHNLTIFSIYLSLFLFPCLLIYAIKAFAQLSQQQKHFSLFIIIAIIATTTPLIITGARMPLMGNVLEYFSLGPQSLEGYYNFLQIFDYKLINLCWMALQLLGILGGLLLFFSFFIAMIKVFNKTSNFEKYKKQGIILNAATIFFYLGIIAGLQQELFDRYLIFVLPSFLVLIMTLENNLKDKKIAQKTMIISWCFVILLAGFSITATHDYLARNRVRWEALNTLMEQANVSPLNINGGSEFNGWYLGNNLETCNPDYSPEQTNVDWESFTCLWGNLPKDNVDSYTVAFIPKEEYTIKNVYYFRRWLPWRQESLYVLRKI